MRRISILSLFALLSLSCVAEAQVFVRAPFVRVYVDGPDWQVRAPFVNIGSGFTGSQVRYSNYSAPLYMPYADEPMTLPQQPAKASEGVPTLEAFARSFQAKAGYHEAVVQNPLTGEPNTIRFTLPEGEVQRILLHRAALEFEYGSRRFVKIEFDREGPTVYSR